MLRWRAIASNGVTLIGWGLTRILQDMHFSTSRIFWTFIVSVLSTLFLVEAVRLIVLRRSVTGNKIYWAHRAAQPHVQDDFVYLALGDSVANGIGASSPQNGYVGLIARHIQEATGRNVHVINFSVTGATTADVLRDQLPKIQDLHPDLVTLDIGANDVNKKVPEDTFIKNFSSILESLPAGKTIVSDLPTFERGPKQSTLINLNEVIHSEIAAHNLRLAPIFDLTSATIHDWTTYGADFFHPSNKGHRNWYRAFETELDCVLNDQGEDEMSS